MINDVQTTKHQWK